MAQKTIQAVIVDATISETFNKTPYGEQFVSAVELQLRDIETDKIYIKNLTDAYLCEITGIEKTFSPLEIIKIAEHLRRFTQPLELRVDDATRLITNDMITMTDEAVDIQSEDTEEKKKKPAKARRTRSVGNKNFGFNPEKAATAMATRQRNNKTKA